MQEGCRPCRGCLVHRFETLKRMPSGISSEASLFGSYAEYSRAVVKGKGRKEGREKGKLEGEDHLPTVSAFLASSGGSAMQLTQSGAAAYALQRALCKMLTVWAC